MSFVISAMIDGAYGQAKWQDGYQGRLHATILDQTKMGSSRVDQRGLSTSIGLEPASPTHTTPLHCSGYYTEANEIATTPFLSACTKQHGR